MTTAIEIVELEKTFDPSGLMGELRRLVRRPTTRVAALRRVTLRVARGEIYGVVGSNGSGKSTLARIVATLLIPDAGRAEVFGHDVQRETVQVRRLLNRVSVEASFFKKLSPLENLIFTARLYDLPPSDAEPRVREILQRLGIGGATLTRPIEQMSRGMQQKVAVARAFPDLAGAAGLGRTDDRAGPRLEARRAGLCPRSARQPRRHGAAHVARHG